MVGHPLSVQGFAGLTAIGVVPHTDHDHLVRLDGGLHFGHQSTGGTGHTLTDGGVDVGDIQNGTTFVGHGVLTQILDGKAAGQRRSSANVNSVSGKGLAIVLKSGFL
jgi:hypothetical protein